MGDVHSAHLAGIGHKVGYRVIASSPKAAVPKAIALTLVCVVWGYLLTRVSKSGVFQWVGPFSIVVTLAALWSGTRLAAGLRYRKVQAVALGVGSGLIMALAMYPAFRAASGIFPALSDQVSALYLLTRGSSKFAAFFWTTCILISEEYLWRGAYFESLTGLLGITGAAGVSVAVYALVQLGTGSAIVALLALVCGAVWMALRIWTGSILPPLLSHAVWTYLVLLFFPVI